MQTTFDDALTDISLLNEARERALVYFGHVRQIAEQGSYGAPESSVCAPFDAGSIASVIALKDEICSEKLRTIFLVGIGGSSLGAKAIYEAERAAGHSELLDLVFLESPDPYALSAYEKTIAALASPEECLIIVISKSGTTLETTANFSWLYERCKTRFGDIDTRIAVITDEGSPLAHEASEKKWHMLTIPHTVGGRFSVFTPVGLFPLACAGLDIRTVIQGAQEGRARALSQDSPHLDLALTRYLWYKAGFSTETFFVFHPHLLEAASWRRQLTAESLGKKNKLGEAISLLPEVSLGSSDLHSIAQLYMGALTRQSTIFLSIEQTPNVSLSLLHKTAGEVMHILQSAVGSAYQESKKPYASVRLADGSVKELASWMQGAMIETMLLAHLFEVNCFDQPDVERYKKYVRELL